MIYNFKFDNFIIYSSNIVIVILFRYVNFVNNVTTTMSDQEIIKIKVIDLDEFYNIYVHDFFS